MLARNRPRPWTLYAMSISETSFSFCFCRFDIIENAMSSVSSGDRRGASATGCNSPPMRMTGNDPAFKCKSDARWALAVMSRSSILRGMRTLILVVATELNYRRGERASTEISNGVGRRGPCGHKHHTWSREGPSTKFGGEVEVQL